MNQVIAKSRRKYGGSEFKGIFPQNPADKTQMSPFDFSFLVWEDWGGRYSSRHLSRRQRETEGHFSISSPLLESTRGRRTPTGRADNWHFRVGILLLHFAWLVSGPNPSSYLVISDNVQHGLFLELIQDWEQIWTSHTATVPSTVGNGIQKTQLFTFDAKSSELDK